MRKFLINFLVVGAALATSTPAHSEAPATGTPEFCYGWVAPHGDTIRKKMEGYIEKGADSWQSAATQFAGFVKPQLGVNGCDKVLAPSDFMKAAGVSDATPLPGVASSSDKPPLDDDGGSATASEVATTTKPTAADEKPAPVVVETRTIVQRLVADPALKKEQQKLKNEQEDLLAQIKVLKDKPGPLTAAELSKLKRLLDKEKGIQAQLKGITDRLDGHDWSINALTIGLILLAAIVVLLGMVVALLWYHREKNQPRETDDP